MQDAPGPSSICDRFMYQYRSNVDLITKGNLSHYQMIAQVEKKFRKWSPATFMGFSSVAYSMMKFLGESFLNH